ncbi:MAG: S41 family peptidase [Parasphingopyxis sp.]|uniref:S41 family peptidase n=1 Tax=Parasphingopyxis sp. TaxID=1920299 RepID=UPI003FA184A8
MRIILIAAIFAILPFGSVPAQRLDPVGVTGSVARLVEENFYDAERATEIASALRMTAESGEWDRAQEPLRLAELLSSAIAEYDNHFRVTWSPPEDAGAQADQTEGQRLYGFGDLIRRSGYGFREVGILPGNIGYIEMTFFAHIDFDDPADPAWAAANAALALVSQSDAVIIDLRENGGGSPAMVGYLASAFTDPDARIYNIFHSRSGTESEAPAVFHPAPRTEVPLYILTSGRTGSAGEALPYTLQAANRATIIGEASYGAANPGQSFDAGDGFAVFISTGSPVNPITGTNWEGSGVRPDVESSYADALQNARIAALTALLVEDDAAYRLDREWALAALRPVPETDIDAAELVGDYGRLTISQSDSGLHLQRGRRPLRTLVPLSPDLFYRANDPLRRYRFARDEAGAVIALESLRSDGAISRFERD